jgi:hypothetical protein
VSWWQWALVWLAASAIVALIVGRVLGRLSEMDERRWHAIQERDKARDEWLRHIREKAGDRDG